MIGGRLSSNGDQRMGASGSVLVPVVAAMLILLLAGGALAELFGAQRMRSVLSVESTEAFWIAEAGLWHAAHGDTDIATPVPFASGAYTVTKSGDDYVATGTWDQAARVVSFTFTGSSGGGGSSGPLDEAASAATASVAGGKKVTLDLISTSSSDAVIESFALSADVSTEKLRRVDLDSNRIWQGDTGSVDLPTGVLALNRGTTAERTIVAGASPPLLLSFQNNPSPGAVVYTLVLFFTDGTSSTITFTIAW